MEGKIVVFVYIIPIDSTLNIQCISSVSVCLFSARCSVDQKAL